jgi:hypothetical protein
MRWCEASKATTTKDAVLNIQWLPITALGWLDQAVTGGWQYADQLAQDDDLKSLRGSPAFQALVARAQAYDDEVAAEAVETSGDVPADYSFAVSSAGTSPDTSAHRRLRSALPPTAPHPSANKCTDK